MEEGVHTRLSRSEGRRFGLTVGLAFAGLAGLLLWRGHTTAMVAAATLSLALLSGGMLLPTRLGPVQATWMKLAALISKVTTPIVMSIIYFIVLTPIGFLLRRLGKNPVEQRRSEVGYWVERNSAKSDLERQF